MSSLKDLASLIMVPSLYKDGRLDTVKPLGNGILHPDSTGNHDGTDGSTPAEGNFTFSRGSNLAATRVDVNGLIEKGRENLLLQSNSFSVVTWTKAALTISGGQSGYDGSTDAWLLSQDGGAGYVEQAISQSGVYTLSVYAKAGIYDWLRLRINTTGTTQNAYFNLSGSGSIGGSGVGVDKTIASIGGGWYKCSITSATQSTSIRIYPAFGDGDVSGTSGNIYIQDAQLEQGLVATDYIETGTSAAQSGILEDMPRLDYSGGASCPSLLLEPQRTNVVESSEYLGDSSWIQTRMTNSANEAVSPEGVQNATLIANTTDTGNHTTTNILGSYTNASLAVSFYAKKKDNDYLQFGIYNSSTKWSAQKINLSTGAILGSGNTGFHDAPSGVSVTDAGSDWWRVEALFTTSLTGATETLYLAPTPTDANPTGAFGLYGGWTGATTENAYIYGVQVESGVSYPTSYIPTYGSSVTRSDEFFYNYDNLQDLGILGSTWTFMYDQTFELVPRDAACAVFLLDNGNDGDGSASVRVALNTNGSFRLQDSDGTQYSTTANKILCRYDGSKISWYGDGLLINEHNVTGAFNTLDRHNPSGSNKKQIKLNQVLIFPTALTDSECIALTTL